MCENKAEKNKNLEIPEKMGHLDHEINALEETLTELLSRLSSVSRSAEPQEKDKATAGAASDLGEKLDSFQSRIRELREKTGQQLARLEI